ARTVVLVPLPQAPQPTAPHPAAASAAPPRHAPAPQLTVQVTRPVRLHASPGGPVVGGLLPHTSFRSATIVPVVAQRGSWLGVITSALPNGRLGWIEANTALVAYTTPYAITASLRRRQVVVRRSGRVVMRFPVAVGSPSTPTPTGRFAVTDKLLTNDPSSPYGCCILALSADQPRTPQGWGGGDRIAIHATDLPETIGSAASLGCLRAPEADARRVVRSIPLGTVVTISA
ncbi:MAG TPA: L,D-transpeptidase, partial [Conexibacter sp.]|nr:L,D-transpeptidase [Conexibacter sp.]